MAYKKRIDIWQLTKDEINKLQPGQWVTAGGNLGRFWGIRGMGIVVVAWYHNAKNSYDYNDYNRCFYLYAKGL
jgi:hypothetical protein